MNLIRRQSYKNTLKVEVTLSYFTLLTSLQLELNATQHFHKILKKTFKV